MAFRDECCFLSTGAPNTYYCNMCLYITTNLNFTACPKCEAIILTPENFAKKYSNSSYGSGNYGKNKKEAIP